MLKNQQIVVLARKRKSKIWRVRSTPPTGHKYTPEKKKQDLACAEPSPTGHKYTPEKKKQDLTCAEPSQTPSPKLQAVSYTHMTLPTKPVV